MTELITERVQRLQDKPNYVVIGKKDEIYYGVIEQSFSMGLSEDRILVLWTSEFATSNITSGTFKIDGKDDAEYQLKRVSKDYPDIDFEVVKLLSPESYVEIDWEEYAEAGMPDVKRLSGVKDKFRARNARFTINTEATS